MRRRPSSAALLLALGLALAACGESDRAGDTAADGAQRSSSAGASSSSAAPTTSWAPPTTAPAQEWLESGGLALFDRVDAAASAVDSMASPVDPAVLQGQCQALADEATAAGGDARTFPDTAVAAELGVAVDRLADAATSCVADLQAGDVQGAQVGLLTDLLLAQNGWLTAKMTAMAAQLHE